MGKGVDMWAGACKRFPLDGASPMPGARGGAPYDAGRVVARAGRPLLLPAVAAFTVVVVASWLGIPMYGVAGVENAASDDVYCQLLLPAVVFGISLALPSCGQCQAVLCALQAALRVVQKVSGTRAHGLLSLASAVATSAVFYATTGVQESSDPEVEVEVETSAWRRLRGGQVPEGLLAVRLVDRHFAEEDPREVKLAGERIVASLNGRLSRPARVRATVSGSVLFLIEADVSNCMGLDAQGRRTGKPCLVDAVLEHAGLRHGETVLLSGGGRALELVGGEEGERELPPPACPAPIVASRAVAPQADGSSTVVINVSCLGRTSKSRLLVTSAGAEVKGATIVEASWGWTVTLSAPQKPEVVTLMHLVSDGRVVSANAEPRRLLLCPSRPLCEDMLRLLEGGANDDKGAGELMWDLDTVLRGDLPVADAVKVTSLLLEYACNGGCAGLAEIVAPMTAGGRCPPEALVAAARGGSAACVRAVLAAGGDTRAAWATESESPLHVAASQPNLDCLEALLEDPYLALMVRKGADMIDNGVTALQMAEGMGLHHNAEALRRVKAARPAAFFAPTASSPPDEEAEGARFSWAWGAQPLGERVRADWVQHVARDTLYGGRWKLFAFLDCLIMAMSLSDVCKESATSCRERWGIVVGVWAECALLPVVYLALLSGRGGTGLLGRAEAWAAGSGMWFGTGVVLAKVFANCIFHGLSFFVFPDNNFSTPSGMWLGLVTLSCFYMGITLFVPTAGAHTIARASLGMAPRVSVVVAKLLLVPVFEASEAMSYAVGMVTLWGLAPFLFGRLIERGAYRRFLANRRLALKRE